MLTQLVVKAITGYQRSGGSRRWFGITCCYQPTCSQYTLEAIRDVGLWRGAKAGWHRIRRCRHGDSFCYCVEPWQGVTHQSKAKHGDQSGC